MKEQEEDDDYRTTLYECVQLGPTDVILGRGNKVASASGNVNFRRIVWKYKHEYTKAPRRLKSDITQLVIKEVENSDPPGRFVEAKKGRYYVVHPKRVLEKTSQALREKKCHRPPHLADFVRDEQFHLESLLDRLPEKKKTKAVRKKPKKQISKKSDLTSVQKTKTSKTTATGESAPKRRQMKAATAKGTRVVPSTKKRPAPEKSPRHQYTLPIKKKAKTTTSSSFAGASISKESGPVTAEAASTIQPPFDSVASGTGTTATIAGYKLEDDVLASLPPNLNAFFSEIVFDNHADASTAIGGQGNNFAPPPIAADERQPHHPGNNNMMLLPPSLTSLVSGFVSGSASFGHRGFQLSLAESQMSLLPPQLSSFLSGLTSSADSLGSASLSAMSNLGDTFNLFPPSSGAQASATLSKKLEPNNGSCGEAGR